MADSDIRILVVEDEQKVSTFVKQALEEEGYSVTVAGDGETGFAQAMAHDFDLLILDWLLPGKLGVDVCRTLREKKVRTPVLMLTAMDSVEDRVQGLDAGADDYLIKPFNLDELLARVRALLRRGASTPPPILTVFDLTLDPATRRVQRGDRDIELSAREFALLDYLMRNAGRDLSRSMIAEQVWGLDFDYGTNVVDVYINYLRNKIDRGQQRKLIQTVRGVGYRLSDGSGGLPTR
jgi:two-component system copper resistance phosphate regulon response regulator CusR